MTENLGDWSDVRRRLEEQLDRGRHAPASEAGAALFAAAVPEPDPATDDYFRGQLGFSLRDAGSVTTEVLASPLHNRQKALYIHGNGSS